MLNTLNVAQTGLHTSKTQVENVMNNIANENVPGYKRRVVNTSEIQHSDGRITGRGVLINDVSRTTNIYMYQNLIREESKLSDLKELNSMLGEIESIFYETEDAGLSADLNRYFKSIENLRTSPDNNIYKSDLKSNGNTLVSKLKSLYENIEKQEDVMLTKAKQSVDEVNNILKEIGAINQKILDSNTVQNDLLDKRDQLEVELAKYVDVKISREDHYKLMIGEVTAVRFDTNVRTFSIEELYKPQQDAYVEDAVLPFKSNLINTSTWGKDIDLTAPETAEIQHIPVSGGIIGTSATEQLEVLGYTYTGLNNAGGAFDTAEEVVNYIAGAGNAALIADWNGRAENANKQINTITAVDLNNDGTNDALRITYDNAGGATGDVPDISSTTSNGVSFANSIEVERGGDTSTTSEVQTMKLTGTTTGQVYFLGTLVTASNVAGGETAATIGGFITSAPDKANIINNWNNDPANKDRQIRDITDDGNGLLTITYKSHMEDVKVIDETSSRGITYARSEETIKGKAEDSISYTLNGEHTITVTNGETIYEVDGYTIADINGDGVRDQNDIVDKNNAIQALIYKINQQKDIDGKITAYNGKYELDKDGNKILTNDPRHSEYDALNPNKDRYLFIESNTDGEKGKFVGEVLVKDNDNKDSNGNYIGKVVSKDTVLSKEALDDIYLEAYDSKVDINGGSLKSLIDNLKTDSGNNLLKEYKERLDQFAKKLSDFSESYIETSKDKYVHGKDASDLHPDTSKSVGINLFDGANVKSLQFNDSMVNTLNQEKLDYLATIQWKKDIDFDGTGQNNTSFSKFYQETRVEIADNRENVIFKEKSQEAVKESLQTSYDKITKVDKDNEMVELIKFQSAYEANAKIITIVDEMLQTLLNMKR